MYKVDLYLLSFVSQNKHNKKVLTDGDYCRRGQNMNMTAENNIYLEPKSLI